MSVARFLRIARQRVRSLLRKDALDAELRRELAFHLEQLVHEKHAEGLSPVQARRAAQQALGNLTSFEEACRDERRISWVHDLGQDVVYGLRLLRKRAMFTVAAVAAIAMGIGANAAVLSAIMAVRLGPLPFADAGRLVTIRTAQDDRPQLTYGAASSDYLAWKDRGTAFEAIGASLGWESEFSADASASAERVAGQAFTPTMFTTLRIQTEFGRGFTLEDFTAGGPNPIVISHRLWQTRFGGDANIIHRIVRVDGGFRTVVGVMRPDFRFQDQRVDFWIPMLMNPRNADNGSRLFNVVARLGSGVSLSQARADVAAASAQLAVTDPERHGGWHARVIPLRDWLYGWTLPPLLTLEGAAALLLMIACANVASLLVARGFVRRRELAVRAALGAARGRLRRQLLAESVLLALCGGVCSVPVAWLAFRGLDLVLIAPVGLPALAPVPFGPATAGLTLALSLAAGLVMGLAPALAGPQHDLMRGLRDSGSSARGSSRHSDWRDVLVVGQLAVAVVLMVGAGLLLTSFVRLKNRDLHFRPEGLLSLEFKLLERYTHPASTPDTDLPYEMNPPPSLTLQRVHQALRTMTGATSVAGISFPLLTSPVVATTPVTTDDDRGRSSRHPDVTYYLVTPGFFRTIDSPLLQGRDVNDDDSADTPWIAIVNETAARQFWPGQNPIGRHLTINTMRDEHPREVVGLVPDIPIHLKDMKPAPVIYTSYLQQPTRSPAAMNAMFGRMAFLLRGFGDPMTLLPAAQRAAATVDPDRPLTNISAVADARAVPNLQTYVLVLGAVAASAALLAALGLCGVVVQAVHARTREIGVRRALGADTGAIVALLGGRALVVVGAGCILGLAGAAAITRLLASQLWGVTPTDPQTFAAASLLLVATAGGACALPLWRALRIDPTVVLRQE